MLNVFLVIPYQKSPLMTDDIISRNMLTLHDTEKLVLAFITSTLDYCNVLLAALLS